MVKKAKRGIGARGIRTGVQVFFFTLVAFIVTMNGLVEHGILKSFPGIASLHAICPFGGVVTFWDLFTSGSIIKKVHESSVVLALAGILLAILFGPVICGWVCPFGSVQEWLGKLGKRLFTKRYNNLLPSRLDKVLRYLRYAVLAWVIWATASAGKLVFQDVDPYYALFNFWTGEVAIAAFAILGVVLLLSLLVERPFCKYACPYGAFQGIFNLFRVFGIKRNPATCISCKACSRACPMNIDVMAKQTVRDHQCISCLECTSETACPKEETVELAAGRFPVEGKGRQLRVRHLALGILTLAAIFGSVALSSALGYWKVTSSKVPVSIKTGEFAGEADPADIRGSYSWADVASAFGIPRDELMAAFGAKDPGVRVSSLEDIYLGKLPAGTEIGTGSVRYFVALYTGLPMELEEGTLLPQAAIPILQARGKASAERIAEAAAHAFDTSAILEGAAAAPAAASVAPAATVSPSAPAEEAAFTPLAITGKTSFGDLAKAGYDMASVEGIVGSLGRDGDGLREYCEAKGIEFSTVKAALEAMGGN